MCREQEALQEIERLFEEQARDLAELEAQGWQWVTPPTEEELLEGMRETWEAEHYGYGL